MIRTFWRNLFGLSRSRFRHNCSSVSTLEARQLLAATVGGLPAIASTPVVQIDGYYGVNGQKDVLVFSPQNRVIAQIRLRGVTDPNVQPTVTLSGDDSSGFAISPPTPDFRNWGLMVTNPEIFGTRTEIQLRIETQITPELTITSDVTVLTAETMSVTINENPADGRLVVALPAAFRGSRRQLQVIGNTAWTATYSHPVQLKSNGRIVVDNSYTGGYQSPPNPAWIVSSGTLFNYESAHIESRRKSRWSRDAS